MSEEAENPPRTLAAIGLMVLGMFVLASMDTLGKVLSKEMPVVQVAWGRYFFQFALLLLLVPRVGLAGLLTTRRLKTQILRGLLVAVATMCLFTALTAVPLADAYVISFTSPFFVTLLSIPLLGERVGIRRFSAILAGFLGVLLVIRPGFAGFHPMLVLPLITAACFALYQVLTRMIASLPSETPLAMLFYMASVGALAQSAVVPFSWQSLTMPQWAGLAIMGLLAVLGHMILIRALSMASAVTLSPFIYTQLLWALIYGYVLFADMPDWRMAAGCTVIVASGLFMFHREAVRGRELS
ncbi:MAG: DMT family transporter [Geminicoccaceae bacterium]